MHWFGYVGAAMLALLGIVIIADRWSARRPALRKRDQRARRRARWTSGGGSSGWSSDTGGWDGGSGGWDGGSGGDSGGSGGGSD
ncbi:hypothetical protein MOQ72_31535 [Saccharopolyspora sp. K220]|uniref:hypothetical protein n=1 Tax=Saccharopolyspora soli TaxID=2926618 RepID=UPI001F5AF5CC|nr:hypothetical protein [Saccharopolyspora soli]MCI2421976.1 hypothetical protein [Saccharopolyspora soli]